MNRIQSFKYIANTDELLNFLQTREHPYYHHFTTVSTLVKIIKSNKWRFSVGSRMNDQHEYNVKSAYGLRDKIYSTCFCFGDEDNMAMWAMYAIPWEDAVRISIPKEVMLKWVENLNDIQHPALENVSLHDILYIDGMIGYSRFSKFYWARGKKDALTEPDGCDISLSARFTGYLKNSAWKHEQESRLAITLAEETNLPFIDLPLPDNFFQSVRLTTGPWTTDTEFDRQKKRILRASQPSLRKKLKISQNSFSGQIQLRRHCDFCNHQYEDNKNA